MSATKIVNFPAKSTDPRPPAIEKGDLSRSVITERLRRALERLDREQIQIVEIVVAAMMRGGRSA